MLMADPGRALSETKRVLNSGAPLPFAARAAPEPGAPGIVAMADPERIRSLVSGAGFGEPELEEIPFEFRYKDFDDLWDSVVRLAGPLAHAIKALDEGERRATYEAIEQNLSLIHIS